MRFNWPIIKNVAFVCPWSNNRHAFGRCVGYEVFITRVQLHSKQKGLTPATSPERALVSVVHLWVLY